MDSAKIGLIPLLSCGLGIVAIEAAAQYLKADPILVTAAVRSLDICIILGVIYIFHRGFHVIGLSINTAGSGLRQGILWSAGFGALVLLSAGILSLAGIAFLPLIQVPVPVQPDRLLLFLVVGGIIGPVAEELVYRGLIYSFLRQWGILIALIGSTALFVFSHKATGGIPITQIVGGLIFAAAYETSKSLYSPIIIHTLGNLALFSVGIANQLMMIR